MDDQALTDDRPQTIAERLDALGVVVADGVDLDADDPCWSDEVGRRLCVATRRAGGRCATVPGRDDVLCNAHSGRLDPSVGGRSLARKRRQASEGAEDRAALMRLGTRAVVAEALQEEAVNVKLAVKALAQDAGSGDREAARALIPWLNQALGMPTERHEVTEATTIDELQHLTTAELAARVAQGRSKRLHAVGE